jgi:MFS family permease
LPQDQFLSWGWRLAFWLSVLLVAVGLYIRLRILETPAFTRIRESGALARVPFVELLRTHTKQVLLGLGTRWAEGVAFNIYGVFIIAYLVNQLQLPQTMALLDVMAASGVMIFFILLYGALSDRIGRRLLFGSGALVFGLGAFPAFWLITTRDPALILLAILIAFGIAYPAMYGPQAAFYAELFHPRVRYSGVSFVYQFSGIFASGLTPVVATALVLWGGGQPWLVAGYMLVVGLTSLTCTYLLREPYGPASEDLPATPSGAQARSLARGQEARGAPGN